MKNDLLEALKTGIYLPGGSEKTSTMIELKDGKFYLVEEYNYDYTYTVIEKNVALTYLHMIPAEKRTEIKRLQAKIAAIEAELKEFEDKLKQL